MKRIMLLSLVLVLGGVSFAWAGKEEASSRTAVLSDVQKEIVNILSRLKFQLADQTKFCRQFLKDFQMQATIKYVEPIVAANNYNDPALDVYKQKCPKLDLRKRVLLAPRVADAVEKLPDEEAEKYGDVYVGTANFKLYKIDINNNPSDGEEFVFYHEKFLHVSHIGEEVLSEDYDNRGEYLVVDFDNCKVRYGVPVDNWRETATVKDYNGIITYQNANYIFDLFPSHGPETYSLQLWKYTKPQKRLVPTCLIQPVLKKVNEAN